MTEKIIVVVGATGTQGGSVFKALVASSITASNSKIRCLTRNAKSDKAKALQSKSPKVEIVECDIHDYASVKAAFKNAWAVFAVTNFWDPTVGTSEFKCGLNMVKAAKENDVKFFIWSSLGNCEAISHGKYKVEHFTQKAKVSEEARQLGLPLIEVQLGFYSSNFQLFMKPEKDPQNPTKFVYQLPVSSSTTLPFVDPEDTGPVVAKILENPDAFVGKVIPIYGEMSNLPRAVKTLSEVTGKFVEYQQVSYQEAAHLGPELLSMHHYFDEFGYYPPGSDLQIAKKLYPNLKSFKEWAVSSHFQLN